MIKCITENEANLQAIRPIMNKWPNLNDKPQLIQPTNEPKDFFECIDKICITKNSGHLFWTCYDDCKKMYPIIF